MLWSRNFRQVTTFIENLLSVGICVVVNVHTIGTLSRPQSCYHSKLCINTNYLTSWVSNQCSFAGIFGCAGIHFFSEDFAALIEFNFVFHSVWKGCASVRLEYFFFRYFWRMVSITGYHCSLLFKCASPRASLRKNRIQFSSSCVRLIRLSKVISVVLT